MIQSPGYYGHTDTYSCLDKKIREGGCQYNSCGRFYDVTLQDVI